MVSRRAFRRAAIVSARGKRSFTRSFTVGFPEACAASRVDRGEPMLYQRAAARSRYGRRASDGEDIGHRRARFRRRQDAERYVGIVAASGRTLFDRDMPPGAEPEEIMAMKVPAAIIPGDDPAHATSGAHYLREL